jgi:hypothetical protein
MDRTIARHRDESSQFRFVGQKDRGRRCTGQAARCSRTGRRHALEDGILTGKRASTLVGLAPSEQGCRVAILGARVPTSDGPDM